MNPRASNRPLAWLPWLTPLAALAIVALAALAIAGWVTGTEWLRRLSPSGPAMNPLTAAVLVLAAAGVLLETRRRDGTAVLPRAVTRLGRAVCGGAVLLVGLVK